MKKFNYAPILTIISILMILAMIVVTFLPCWQLEVTERIDGEKVTYVKDLSISSFSWNAKEYKDLSKNFEKEYDTTFVVNDEVFMPCLLLVAGAVLIVFSLVKIKSVLGPLAALVLGIFSWNGYANSLFLWTSGSVWMVGYYLGLASAIVGGICVVLWAIPVILRKKKEHEERKALYGL